MREFIAFFHIALPATADKVLPGGRSPGVLGHNVVDGHIPRCCAAVLAEVVVPCKNSASREFKFRHRAADVPAQFDDGGHHKAAFRGGELVIVFCVQNVGFAEVDHDNGSAHIADVQRFIVAVQDERFLSHPGLYLSSTVWRERHRFRGRDSERPRNKNPLLADSAERAFRHEFACIAHHDSGVCGEDSADERSNPVSLYLFSFVKRNLNE